MMDPLAVGTVAVGVHGAPVRWTAQPLPPTNTANVKTSAATHRQPQHKSTAVENQRDPQHAGGVLTKEGLDGARKPCPRGYKERRQPKFEHCAEHKSLR